MKKYLMFIILLILPFLLVGCTPQENEGLVLRVYNWQDYIDEGLDDEGQKIGTSVMEEWQEWYYQTYGEKVEIVYDTFETCETMMNTLKTGKTYTTDSRKYDENDEKISTQIIEEYSFDDGKPITEYTEIKVW